MKGSQASLQPRAPTHPSLQHHLVNELFVLLFDLQAHGYPREPLEHVLQTHHVPVRPVCKAPWVGCGKRDQRGLGWGGAPWEGDESQRRGRPLTW